MRQFEDIINRYKNKYPYLSKAKLATLIVENENLDYSYETIRKLISQYNKIEVSDMNLDDEDFEIPETSYIDRLPYILPKANDNILIIGDVHIPFHDKQALKTTLQHGRDRKVNTIIINGDCVDFISCSRFIKSPDMGTLLPYEIKIAKEFFALLRKLFPNVKIIYKKGNHEERLDHYIWTNAPALFGLKEVTLEHILDFGAFDVELVDYQRVIEIGQLNVIHGHELKSFGGVNVARTSRLKAIDNILTHHFHRYQEDTGTTIRGEVQGGFSVGCLCGLKPDYMPINSWSHGFAIVERNSDDTFFVDNKKIICGRCL